jgi:hypothetical protein
MSGGGAETYFNDLAKELEARGDEVIWLTGPIINLKGLHLFTFIARAFIAPDADVYVSNLVFSSGTTAVLAGKIKGKPSIVTCEGGDCGDYGGKLWWFAQPFITWTLQNATRVQAISKYCAGLVKDKSGIDSTIIPLFIRC